MSPHPARRFGVLCGGALLLAVVGTALSAAWAGGRGQDTPKPTANATPLAVDEARRLLLVMDDIYHAGVLATHKMYVQEPGSPSAVTWAKQVFRKVNGAGWPSARIFAATDRPLNPENEPQTGFEREAIGAFRQGKPSHERVDGTVLLRATPIRIPDRSCLICHVRNKEGDLLGGVSYRALLKP